MNNKPDPNKRKLIRLKGVDYSNEGMYFVTICTQDKVQLFGEIIGSTLSRRSGDAGEMVEKWIGKTEEKFPGVRTDKYVVMPNHVHLIISIQRNPEEQGGHMGPTGGHTGPTGGHTGPPLQEIVGWIKTMTTNEYIKGVKAGQYVAFNKRVWQRSFYDHIIRDEDDYQRIWEYIDENPATWSEDEYFA